MSRMHLPLSAVHLPRWLRHALVARAQLTTVGALSALGGCVLASLYLVFSDPEALRLGPLALLFGAPLSVSLVAWVWARRRPSGEPEAHEGPPDREQQLRRLRARVETLSAIDCLGIAIWDSSGQLIESNAAFLRITDASLQELRKGQFAASSLLPNAGRARPREGEGVLVHRDGARVCVRYWVKRLEPDGEHMACLMDITETEQSASALRSLEAQLEQAQTLEATGRLAGGVAHDFNNLMAVVLGYCDVLLADFGPETKVHAAVLEIRHAGERAAELTRQLLAFSRRQVLQPRVVELGAMLAKMDRFARRTVGENIAVSLFAQPEPCPIEIDPGQLEQIMMSLLANARDAMPDGGSVSVEVSEVELSAASCDEHPGLRPGPHVRLRVSDTGCGMDEATRAQVFSPYFTTKPKGRRSPGLGLSAVLGIVQQSGGHITVESQLGIGTTVSLFFRRADAPAAPASSPDPSRAGGRERILLVEDDVPVRVLTRKLLENLGYAVLEAGSPADAIEICRSHSGCIHLLLTDLMMPSCNGSELASRVRPLRPDIKVLYMSGYTDDTIGDHGVIAPGTHFLQKPFTLQRLGSKVREALQGGKRAAVGPSA